MLDKSCCLDVSSLDPQVIFKLHSVINEETMASLRSSPEVVDLTAVDGISTARTHYAPRRRHANNFVASSHGVEVIDLDDEPKGGYKTDPNLRHAEKARKRKRPLQTPGNFVDLRGDDAGENNDDESPFTQVLRVFPEVDQIYLEKILFEHGNDVAAVVSALADNDSYPKYVNRKPAPAIPLVSVEEEVKKWTYDFMSMESFEPKGHYHQQAQVQLLMDCKSCM